jgi:molybdopterin-guanine dinucleotide biosynthesis protein A
MKSSTKKSIFVFASDMPFLKGDLISQQLNYSQTHHADAVIPEINGSIEPLHGIYKNHLLSKLEDYLSSGNNYSLKGFLDKINVDLFRPEITSEILRAFVNINTPGEAEKYGISDC